MSNYRELAFPNKDLSLHFFLLNWKNVLIGTSSYILENLSSPKLVYQLLKSRLNFAIKKKSVDKPIRTPEGFHLINNSELLVYTQIFIEKNLKNNSFIKDLVKQDFPIVFDVGYNCGLFTKWLFNINNKARFFCFEVLDQNIERSLEIDKECLPYIDKTIVKKAVWSKSNLKIPIYIGDSITTDSTTKNQVDKSFLIESIALDDYNLIPKDAKIFAIKIDTDGSNIEVLKGAKERLKYTEWLLIENEYGQEKALKEIAPQFKLIAKSSPVDFLYRNDF